VTTTRERQPATRSQALMWVLYLCDAGLLITSGLIHLHFWDIAYRHVKTLDVLFLIQVIAALLAAVVLLATRWLIVVLGSLALLAGTIVGFILARTVGIFGFKLGFSSGLANTVLIVEIAGVILLAITAGLMLRSSGLRGLMPGSAGRRA
jgi:hypothetical protein